MMPCEDGTEVAPTSRGVARVPSLTGSWEDGLEQALPQKVQTLPTLGAGRDLDGVVPTALRGTAALPRL